MADRRSEQLKQSLDLAISLSHEIGDFDAKDTVVDLPPSVR